MRISGFLNYSGIRNHNLRLGAGHDDLDLYKATTYKNFVFQLPGGVPVPTGPVQDYSDTEPLISPHRRLNNYLYLQDEWLLYQDWTLTAGVRHDRYSDFGSTTNPRLALVWDTSANLTSKLLWSSAFRAPAFVEMYGTNPSQQGNPDLRPEQIAMRELAFNWLPRKELELNLNVFRYDIDDLISVVQNPVLGSGGSWQNTGSVRGKGAEMQANWQASQQLRLSANGAWQRATDLGAGQSVGYAPNAHYYLLADWRARQDLRASAQLNRVRHRDRQAGDPREPVPDYTTLDLTLRFNINRNWELAGSLRNLFDARVIEPTLPNTIPTDRPEAGRNGYLQLLWRID